MGVPLAQAPCELQVDGSVRALVVVLQVPGAQMVPSGYLRHAPLPLQVPSVPHELLPMSWHAPRGSGPPTRAMVQLPGTVPRAQDRHGPWQASEQQTLSTQRLLAHSTPSWQGWPRPFFPQLPALHTMPVTQSVSAVQVARQAPVAAEQV